jgi:hypothetical protein
MKDFIIKNWKTNSFGIATVIVYALSYFFPQHKDFLTGLMAVLIAGGLLSAKDHSTPGV